MKKISIALAILLVASFSAHAQTVTSTSVMGYTKVAAPASGYGQIAVSQFSDGSTNNAESIQSVIDNLDDLNAGDATSGLALADKIHFYTGSGYNSYGLFDNGSARFWLRDNDLAWSISDWTPSEASTNATVSRGVAVWFEPAPGGSTNLLVSGNIYNDDTFEVAVGSGYTMIAYPYSSQIAVTNLVISNTVGSDAASGLANADKIHFYTGSGYISYALFDNGASTFWLQDNDLAWSIPDWTPILPTNIVNLGQGFWFEPASGSGKTIGFSKIYTVD